MSWSFAFGNLRLRFLFGGFVRFRRAELPSQREDGIVAGAPRRLGGDGETTTDDKRVWAKRMVPRASAYPWAGVSLGVGDSAK
ncbi:unnamed protein product [Sphagnum troendelagicum]|uniref:Secreted protein n=1 Tax=Sphagnum troendelagicum TaxID=128251 RepID=A0ABP0UPK7_9BRYO